MDVQVNTNYTFTLLAAHLKSKRAVAEADEAELRLEEAKLLREKIDARLAANPNANLVVLGDFNDRQGFTLHQSIIGRGKQKLVDTRPAERNGDDTGAASNPPANRATSPGRIITAGRILYSRIDFILLSPGLAREWVTERDLRADDSQLGRRLRPPAHRGRLRGGGQVKPSGAAFSRSQPGCTCSPTKLPGSSNLTP